MTAKEHLLLAAHDLAAAGTVPFSSSQLTVAAWKRCPESFGMPGFKALYPDKQRVAADLSKGGSLIRYGYLSRHPDGGYRLTDAGKAAAARLLNPAAKPAPAKPPRYEVLTWDPETGEFTPQIGVRRGPYTLFGLRAAIRKLYYLGYGEFDLARGSTTVRIRRIDAAAGTPARPAHATA
jgi:hypothetical protein